jgi:DNA polymerase
MLRQIALAPGADAQGFRLAVRALLAAGIPPEAVAWHCGEAPGLFVGQEQPAVAPPVPLPRAVADLAELVVCHSDPERFALLYMLIWRIRGGERALLEVASDPLVHRLEQMRKAVRRELHKMHAFLRFRRTADPNGMERFVAWFEPAHFILEATAGFFVERFTAMDWSILTPLGSLHWDRTTLSMGPPASRSDAPDGDAFEAGWQAYYASTFNPARTNLRAMRAEMPQRYWRNMPEAQGIAALVQDAPRRVQRMIAEQAEPPRKRTPEKALARMLKALDKP